MIHGPRPPVAERIDTRREHHGEVFVDPYEWMRDKSDPRVIAHLEAENSYTEAMTEQASQQTQTHLDNMARLLAQSEALVQARTASEAAWAQQHGERMDALISVLRTELATSRALVPGS